MNIDLDRLSSKNKYTMLHEYLKEYKLYESEFEFIGDDVIEIEKLIFAGYSYAPNDACAYVKDNLEQ